MAVNFSGINHTPQMTQMKKTPMAEVSFQAKPQIDSVSFGMAKQAKAAKDLGQKLGKLDFSKILTTLKTHGKKILDFITSIGKRIKDCFSAVPKINIKNIKINFKPIPENHKQVDRAIKATETVLNNLRKGL